MTSSAAHGWMEPPDWPELGPTTSSPIRSREPSPGLVRRTTTSHRSGSGGPVVASPEQMLSEWYEAVTDLAEKLFKGIERLEGGPSAPRQWSDTVEAPVETTRNIVLTLRVMAKAGHVLVLPTWAVASVAYLRIKHLVGFH